MALTFRGDEQKARTNLAKHGVSFEEAAGVFADPLSLTVPDPLHSASEQRYIIVGESSVGRLLAVAHTEQAEVVRLISARVVTAHERSQYEQES